MRTLRGNPCVDGRPKNVIRTFERPSVAVSPVGGAGPLLVRPDTVVGELRVADPSSATLADFVALYPDATSFGTVDEMLASETAAEDDVVIVATPPFAHRQPAIAALESGRHVLCEKPLAMSADEAEDMLRVAGSGGRLLGACSTRFRREALASGALGAIYRVTLVNRWDRSISGIEFQTASTWFLDASRSGSGVLMDWGPYDISSLDDTLPAVRDRGDGCLDRPSEHRRRPGGHRLRHRDPCRRHPDARYGGGSHPRLV